MTGAIQDRSTLAWRALRRAVVTLPAPVSGRIYDAWRWSHRHTRPVRWGSLRRVQPLSWFGFDRGLPVDRYYLERFLDHYRSDIHGRVLEVENDAYTRKFGATRVSHADVLHVRPGFPGATVIGDLSTGEGIPAGSFDCIILTQTLPFIYDVSAAIANMAVALRRGGVVLAAFPGISRISRPDMEQWGEYWRFTSLSARLLFGEVFPADRLEVNTCGNVLAATAVLFGVASEELDADELSYHDPDFEVLITVRAQAAP